MSTRRSKKVKNLEEEVESVLSQEESDEDCKMVSNEMIAEILEPEQKANGTTSSREHQGVLQDLIQTPRRSCRKSIKPAQDYDDIVGRSLRSCTRSAKKSLVVEEESENDEANVRPKWTPANVGRFSQKRGRKSKRLEKEINKNYENAEQLGDKIEECSKTKEELENSKKAIDAFKLLDGNLEKTDLQKSERILAESSSNMQSVNVSEECVNKQEIKGHNKSIVNSNSNVETQCPSLHVIKGDSKEDDYESTYKSVPEGICVINEYNIRKNSVNQSKSPESITTVGKDMSFGCYLKSKEMNIADLGLNPISHEDDKDGTNLSNEFISNKETEEMPSLIICDDDDEINLKKEILNETFEANDDTEVASRQKEDEEIMEVLELSDDDCETPKKHPRIVLTDTNAQNHTLLSNTMGESPIRTEISSVTKALKKKLPSTPKHSVKELDSKSKNVYSTPKADSSKFPSRLQSRKQYRLPTPYRKRNFDFNDETKENVPKKLNKGFPNSSLASILTTSDAKEIVLSGIRQRSLSVSVNEQHHQNTLNQPFGKQKKNRVVSFHSPANQTTMIDDLDTIIAKSVKKNKPQEKESANKFVTTRRKRSISLDESFLCASKASRLPRPVLIQNVADKAKNPTSSKTLKRTKLPNFAAIHEKQFNRMENLVDHVNRKQERSKNLINSATKLMSASAQKNILPLNKSNNNKAADRSKAIKKIVLNPKLQKTENSDLNKKTATPKKPAFNLSTSVSVKPTAIVQNFVEKANTSRLHNDTNTESRLQRHMELFKGRAASTRAGGSRKNEVILKGVRSNRRFELQMQHRKNLEQ